MSILTPLSESEWNSVALAPVPAFTPAPNRLLLALIVVSAYNDLNAQVVSVTGTATSGWQRVRRDVRDEVAFEVWACISGSAPVSGTLSVTTNPDDRGVVVLQADEGYGGASVAEAIVQAVDAVETTTSVGIWTISAQLDVFASQSNATALLWGSWIYPSSVTPTAPLTTDFFGLHEGYIYAASADEPIAVAAAAAAAASKLLSVGFGLEIARISDEPEPPPAPSRLKTWRNSAWADVAAKVQDVSGTVAALARNFDGVHWQPGNIDPGRGGGQPSEDVIFSDDFSSGDFLSTYGDAKWLENVNVFSGNSPTDSGNKTARFPFSASINWCELNFDLGDLYTEIWAQFDLYIPPNYYHRWINLNNNAGSNNKFIALWGQTYSEYSQIGVETWANMPEDGFSQARLAWNSTGGGIGASGDTDFNFITQADLGKWVTFKLWAKAATSSAFGSSKMWKNGALVLDNTNALNNYSPSAPNAYRYGYLLGYANADFTQNTEFHIDNVVFSTTEAGLTP